MDLPLQIAAEYSTAPATTMVRQNANESEPQDLLIYGLGGWCDGWGAEKLGEAWIANHFKGTTIHINGEWFGGLSWQNESQPPPIHQYHIGYVCDSCQSVRVHPVVWILLKDPQDLDRLSDPLKNQKQQRKSFWYTCRAIAWTTGRKRLTICPALEKCILQATARERNHHTIPRYQLLGE